MKKKLMCLLLTFLMVFSIVPMASADHEHDFSTGRCSCGEWKPLRETHIEPWGVYEVNVPLWKKAYMRVHPYQVSDESIGELICTLKPFSLVAVDGYVVNGFGNTWYKVWYKGKSGYIVADKLDYYGCEVYLDTEKVTKPSGNLPLGKPFRLEGKITSNFDIRQVRVLLQGPNGYVRDISYYPASRSFDFGGDGGPDRDFVFGSLSKGDYDYRVYVTGFCGYDPSYPLIWSRFSIT